MIYLDNAATTPLCESALEAFTRVSCEKWGNPSSLHAFGLRAKSELDAARRAIASVLGAKESEITFTSGGSESDSMALLGAAARYKTGRILVSALEHPAVSQPLRRLEEAGFEIVTIAWGGSAEAFLANVAAAADSNTILASFMPVHNETGLILPVTEAAALVKKANPKALVHCDGAQAFCKIPLHVSQLGADMFSFSAHKFHGPQGVGGLYLKTGVKIKPLITGGGQENGLRSGTEPIALAAAMAAAATEWHAHSAERTAEALAFRAVLEQRLTGTGIFLNLSQQSCSPFILSVSVPPVPSEVLLRILEGEGILVSSGSACSKNKKGKTAAALLPKLLADSVIRVSLGAHSKAAEANLLADALLKAAQGFGRYSK